MQLARSCSQLFNYDINDNYNNKQLQSKLRRYKLKFLIKIKLQKTKIVCDLHLIFSSHFKIIS